MLILVAGLLVPVAMVTLYRYFVRKRDGRARWHSAAAIGASVGITRAILACTGWYVVEHTGGPLQIPAFALAMLAWPEAIVFGGHRGPVPLGFYPVLALLLIVTSMSLVTGVALAAHATHGQRDVRSRS